MGAVAGGERPLTTNTRQIESWRQEGEVMLILLSYDSTYYLAVCSWNILRYGLGARCARAPSSMLQVARSERGRHAERFQRQRSGPPLSSIPQHTHAHTRACAHTQCHAHNDAVIIYTHACTYMHNARKTTHTPWHARTCVRTHAHMRTRARHHAHHDGRRRGGLPARLVRAAAVRAH